MLGRKMVIQSTVMLSQMAVLSRLWIRMVGIIMEVGVITTMLAALTIRAQQSGRRCRLTS